jgi:ornithine cyclodeaminase/alanine dehydrogenase-like protein (mu-crystallin family)
MKQCVSLMRDTFTALREGRASNQPRRRIVLPTGSTLHSMGGAWGKYFGTKFYSTNPKHGAHFFFYLFDAETAAPLAQFEANWLGQIRTGAASGYATDVLAAPAASTLGIIGSGFQAASQIAAIREVRNLQDIRVWSRSEEKRDAFAKEHGARAVASAEEAVRGADIVVTATFSGEPVLESSWIKDGAHIDAMGSNRGNRRELPTDLIQRANLIAIDSIEQGKVEAGDLLMAGVDWTDPRIVELAKVTARPSGNPVTIFESLGLGVEDVIAGAFVYEQLTA